jgi:hypothetical protein
MIKMQVNGNGKMPCQINLYMHEFGSSSILRYI